jgi:molybdate transport system substrate-binding protein
MIGAGVLHFLSAGAAQGLVVALQGRFEAETGVALKGRFGAVGAMQEALRAGEPCDLIILTDALIDTLAAAGELRADTKAALGRVRTGVAVRAGDPQPDVSTPQALKTALLAADAVHFPDPQRATAGIHFAAVLRQLGIHDELAPRFRTYPNGATAMRELAASRVPQPIGCTQVSEILHTPGVSLCGALPERFELATVYSAAVSSAAAQPALAQRLIALLASDEAQPLREQLGFER